MVLLDNGNDKKRNEMKLPIYMKAGKDNKTIIVKWWGILWLKFRYVFLSNVVVSSPNICTDTGEECKHNCGGLCKERC